MISGIKSFWLRASLVVLIVLCATISARAEAPRGDQVLLETWVLRLDTNSIPADIRPILSQDSSQTTESRLLTSRQQDDLLKAATGEDSRIVACPTLLMLAGSEAQVTDLLQRPYVSGFEPSITGKEGMHIPQVSDAEAGLKLKVKAEPSAEGKSVRLTFSAKLTSLLKMDTFWFSQSGANNRLVIQRPDNQQISIDTTVTVPDGKTLLLGGQVLPFQKRATDKNKLFNQTVLILLRPTTINLDALPGLPGNAPVAMQTKFLCVPSNFPPDFRSTFLPSGQLPILDDAHADAMTRAVESSVGASAITASRVTLDADGSCDLFTGKSTAYVKTFAWEKDSAGQLRYTPKINSVEDGYSLKFRSAAVPDRNTTAISADVTFTKLLGIDLFTFVEKPQTMSVQEPVRQVVSASVQACIPDKHWFVIGPLRADGQVETEVRPSFLSRLFGEKPQRVVRPSQSDLYILIRPEPKAD